VRIAALWALPAEGIDAISAFEARAILVDQFSEAHALLLACRDRTFDAILVQDRYALSRPWLEVLQAQVASRIPIIVVSVGDAHSIAQALMLGADDYATHAEGAVGLVQRVLARVRSRAAAQQQQPLLRVGVYSLHAMQRILASPGHQVRLTVRECNLAQVLFEHHGRLATFDMLMAVSYGNARTESKRSIEQHVSKLRKKCALVSSRQATPLSIESIYASGYRLKG
jgi:DNA-binding response OmpR family regulator